MPNTKGWTFIELIITLLLLSLLGAFVLTPKLSFHWQEQKFIQSWFQLLNQAKEYAYFRETLVTVKAQPNDFIFVFENMPDKTLNIQRPDFVNFPEEAFPLLISFDESSDSLKGQGWVELKLPLKTIKVDRQTLYAYVENTR